MAARRSVGNDSSVAPENVDLQYRGAGGFIPPKRDSTRRSPPRLPRLTRPAAVCGSIHGQTYPFTDARAHIRIGRELVQAGHRSLEQIFEVVEVVLSGFFIRGPTHWALTFLPPASCQRSPLCFVPDTACSKTKMELSAGEPSRRAKAHLQLQQARQHAAPRAQEMPKMRKSSLTARLHHSGRGGLALPAKKPIFGMLTSEAIERSPDASSCLRQNSRDTNNEPNSLVARSDQRHSHVPRSCITGVTHEDR
jgi:hypothetical protein